MTSRKKGIKLIAGAGVGAAAAAALRRRWAGRRGGEAPAVPGPGSPGIATWSTWPTRCALPPSPTRIAR